MPTDSALLAGWRESCVQGDSMLTLQSRTRRRGASVALPAHLDTCASDVAGVVWFQYAERGSLIHASCIRVDRNRRLDEDVEKGTLSAGRPRSENRRAVPFYQVQNEFARGFTLLGCPTGAFAEPAPSGPNFAGLKRIVGISKPEAGPGSLEAQTVAADLPRLSHQSAFRRVCQPKERGSSGRCSERKSFLSGLETDRVSCGRMRSSARSAPRPTCLNEGHLLGHLEALIHVQRPGISPLP